MIRSAIFDLDGTLIESLTCIAGSMNRLLDEEGFPLHDRDTYKKFIGEGVEKLVEMALPELRPEQLKGYVKKYIQIYTDTWRGNTIPFEGISPMLHRLQEMDIGLFILSNKRDDLTIIQARELFPDIGFKFVAGAKKGIPKKPDPEAALSMLRGCGYMPETTLFIGDSGVDMQTAVNGGMVPGGVLWGFRDEKELTRNGAEFLFGQPEEITALIRGKRIRN